MKASTQRFFGLIASLVLFIATISVYAFLLRPAYDDVNQVRGKYAGLTDAVEEERKIVMDVKELLARYQGFTNLNDTISLTLPKREAYPTLVNQIDVMAKNAGIFLDSVNFSALPAAAAAVWGGTKDAPRLNILQMNLKLIGTYSAYKTFLQKIETNVRLMDVVRLNIAPLPTGANYNYTLVVNTYYQSL